MKLGHSVFSYCLFSPVNRENSACGSRDKRYSFGPGGQGKCDGCRRCGRNIPVLGTQTDLRTENLLFTGNWHRGQKTMDGLCTQVHVSTNIEQSKDCQSRYGISPKRMGIGNQRHS